MGKDHVPLCYTYELMKETLTLTEEIKEISGYLLKCGMHTSIPEEELWERIAAVLKLRDKIMLLKEQRSYIKLLAPSFFLQKWAFSSLNASLSHLESAIAKYEKKDFRSFIAHAHSSALFAYQACDIIKVKDFIEKVTSNLEHYHISKDHVKKGDVILSYKSKNYLRHDFLSNLISISTNSPITHALIATNDEHPHIFLSSNAEHDGLSLKEENPERGELYLVFGFREELSSEPKEKILKQIDIWSERARREKWRYFGFAEYKSWVACILGVVDITTTVAFERSLRLPNPVHRARTIFCSELIDNIFKGAGIRLTPESKEFAVVGPSELFYSPYLAFKGIIVNNEDKELFKKEILEKYSF